MADVWVLHAQKDSGTVVGAFSTLALAQAAAGATPTMSYDISLHTIDDASGGTVLMPQRTSGNVIQLPNKPKIQVGKKQ